MARMGTVMKKLCIVLGILCALAVAGVAGIAGGLYYWASRDLPGFTNITDYNPPLVTTVYTRNNEVLGYFYKEKRFLVRIKEMPDFVPQSFLAAEDTSFYAHGGVDILAIARAFFANMRAGHVVQGASTITQQVIKSLLLTPERSYQRKIKEAILAYRLEHYLTKDEILTIYLNQIYFGARSYGIEAASRAYFGCHVQDLTIAQAAMLAGLPKAPSSYNPYRNMAGAIKRQHYVLNRLRELHWITEEQYQEALSEPITLKRMDDPSWHQGAYYLEEVRRRLIERFGEDVVYNAGLHVYTAVDMTHQLAAERSVRDGLIASAKRRGWTGPLQHLNRNEWGMFLNNHPYSALELEQGTWVKALVKDVTADRAIVQFGDFQGRLDVKEVHWARTIDPSKATEEVPSVKDCRKVLNSGDVIWVSLLAVPENLNPEDESAAKAAMWNVTLEREPEVQGALISMEPGSGEVRALVGGYSFDKSQFNRATQARRQPGSAFKPFVYSTGLDNGMTPSTVLLDAPIVYTSSTMVWKPQNFEGIFYGPTLLRTALVKSRNLVTIRLAQRVGIRKIIKRARHMGLESEFPEDLSVSLGSSPVTPLGLTKAYSGFARGGSTVEPRFILSVESAWGDTLYVNEKQVNEDAVSPQTAYIITSLLKEVVSSGTGWRVRRAFTRPIAGKTGTSNDEQDAWFVGFTPYLLTTVWVGFDRMQPMGRFETGSRAASPIWVGYRKAIESQYAEEDFPQPPGIVMARIDAKNGLLAGSATEKSYFLPYKAGTEPHRTSTASTTSPGGSVKAAGEDLLKQVF
ncbi:penicillin-binding protein 1A [Desulfobaculum bizertense DSM 18034]|uniref:Penicillin-binding protein 1A n=2 Tax=Desulfobaculum TaxID=1433996 RepID=A0A1T4WF87_9BACT|nr:penicillin-binding protein 1A [Desulfobaculum bizertense DSM 18034]